MTSNVVYQTYLLNSTQLRSLRSKNSKTVFLFSDNQRDKYRPQNTKRSNIVLNVQDRIYGKYDTTNIVYGITTHFNRNKRIKLSDKIKIWKNEFNILYNKYLKNDYKIIVPSPTEYDLDSNPILYYENGNNTNGQSIFHKIGFCDLTFSELRIIQMFLDNLNYRKCMFDLDFINDEEDCKQDTVQTLKNSHKTISTLNNTLSEENSKLLSRNNSLQNKFDRLRTKYNKSINDVKKQNQMCLLLKQENEKMRSKMLKLTTGNESKSRIIKRLRLKTDKNLLKKINVLNDQLKVAAKNKLKSKQENKKLSIEINNLKLQYTNKTELLTKRLAKLRKKLKISLNNEMELQNENNLLLSEKNELNNKINKLKVEFEMTNQNLKQENENLQKKNVESTELNDKLEVSMNKLKVEFELINDILRKENDLNIEKITTYKNKLQLLSNSEKQLKTENELLVSQKNEVWNRIKKVTLNNENLSKENESLNQQINKLTEESKLLVYNEKQLTAQNQLLISEKNECFHTITKLTRKNESLEQEKQLLNKQINKLSEESKLLTNNEKQLKTENELLLSKQSELQKEIKDLKLEIVELFQKEEKKDNSRNINCEYFKTCQKIVNRIFKIPASYLNARGNNCYCTACHNARGDGSVYYRGNPAKKYALPLGYCRIGIKVDEGFDEKNDVFEKWNVCFHGSSVKSIQSIIDSKLQFLKPGDCKLGGDKNEIKEGHIKRPFWRTNLYTNEQELFDPNQIYTSPSIKYSGNPIYSRPLITYNPDSLIREEIKCNFAFQCRQRPDSYRIGQETIGARRRSEIIDENFSNNEVEWYTKETLGITITGLLVKFNRIR